MPVDTGSVNQILTGDKLSGTDLATWYNAMNALSSARTPYTSTWASSGTAVSLGNGTIVGRYTQVGKFVAFAIQLTMGSSTTFGTGSYSLTLPTTAVAGLNQIVSAKCRDNSAGSSGHFAAIGEIGSGQTFVSFFNVNAQVGQLFPFTWAVSDTLAVSGIYEAA